MVKNDLRLQLDTPASVVLAESLESGLSNPGDCTVMNIDGRGMLIHRSSNGQLVRTPILRDGPSWYIERDNWPTISGRRYAGPEEFSAALKRMGMRIVHIAPS
ncbi:hypothetical protein D3C84_1118650 [compost metagenome]